ncbi:hypothetical protein [Myxococcus sp. CA039A]|uniref:hypothetical protein n=1 Tax=Myxococcus sp. CA039A TaxID=2741737 RepID=UPI00157B7C36|nr:hypothetical protein [Myxococcus sp. CA039A]NTX58383.1 hypothetical protein [Myxococcus sp. CA039A]
MGSHASGTKVPVIKSKMEIDALLGAHGALRRIVGEEPGLAVVVFEVNDRRVRFRMPLPARESFLKDPRRPWKTRKNDEVTRAMEQACREKWRCLLLTIKAKFVSVESQVETFEEAFLAHIVTPTGQTVGQLALPAVNEAYRTGAMPPLLPAGTTGTSR